MMLDFHVERALEVDDREAKLPVWAQEKLKMMRRATSEARTLLNKYMKGSEPGPFWFAPWTGNESKRFYLPKDAGRLMYGDPSKPDEEFTISDGRGNRWGKENTLTVVGRDGLIVMPNCSNVIQLKGSL